MSNKQILILLLTPCIVLGLSPPSSSDPQYFEDVFWGFDRRGNRVEFPYEGSSFDLCPRDVTREEYDNSQGIRDAVPDRDTDDYRFWLVGKERYEKMSHQLTPQNVKAIDRLNRYFGTYGRDKYTEIMHLIAEATQHGGELCKFFNSKEALFARMRLDRQPIVMENMLFDSDFLKELFHCIEIEPYKVIYVLDRLVNMQENQVYHCFYQSDLYILYLIQIYREYIRELNVEDNGSRHSSLPELKDSESDDSSGSDDNDQVSKRFLLRYPDSDESHSALVKPFNPKDINKKPAKISRKTLRKYAVKDEFDGSLLKKEEEEEEEISDFQLYIETRAKERRHRLFRKYDLDTSSTSDIAPDLTPNLSKNSLRWDSIEDNSGESIKEYKNFDDQSNLTNDNNEEDDILEKPNSNSKSSRIDESKSSKTDKSKSSKTGGSKSSKTDESKSSKTSGSKSSQSETDNDNNSKKDDEDQSKHSKKSEHPDPNLTSIKHQKNSSDSKQNPSKTNFIQRIEQYFRDRHLNQSSRVRNKYFLAITILAGLSIKLAYDYLPEAVTVTTITTTITKSTNPATTTMATISLYDDPDWYKWIVSHSWIILLVAIFYVLLQAWFISLFISTSRNSIRFSRKSTNKKSSTINKTSSNKHSSFKQY